MLTSPLCQSKIFHLVVAVQPYMMDKRKLFLLDSVLDSCICNSNMTSVGQNYWKNVYFLPHNYIYNKIFQSNCSNDDNDGMFLLKRFLAVSHIYKQSSFCWSSVPNFLQFWTFSTYCNDTIEIEYWLQPLWRHIMAVSSLVPRRGRDKSQKSMSEFVKHHELANDYV